MKALWKSDWTHLNCALTASDVNVPVCILKFNCVALSHLLKADLFVLFRAFPVPRSLGLVWLLAQSFCGGRASRRHVAPWTRNLSQKSSHLGG